MGTAVALWFISCRERTESIALPSSPGGAAVHERKVRKMLVV